MSSTQVNPNVNLTENVLVLDTNALITGEITFVDQDVVVSGTSSQLIFVGTPGGEVSTYAGIQYRDSTHNNRFALSFRATNDVVLGNRASDGNVRIVANTATAGAGGEVEVAKFEDDQITEYTYTKKGFFTKIMTDDNTATSVFTITTTNESGSADGGAYAVFVKVLGVNAAATPSTSANIASMSAEYTFCRSMVAGGTGSTSAITEITQSASAATTAATRDVTDIALTVSETSEYVLSVLLAVNGAGTSATPLTAHVWVELIWYGFLTAPVLAQA